MLISERDASTLERHRLTQSESLWLRDSLNRRLDRISRACRRKADAERAAIQTDITKAEPRAASIDVDLAELLSPEPGPSQHQITRRHRAAVSTPTRVLTEANFRSQDMTVTAIQSFLDRQPGPLKTLLRRTTTRGCASPPRRSSPTPRSTQRQPARHPHHAAEGAVAAQQDARASSRRTTGRWAAAGRTAARTHEVQGVRQPDLVRRLVVQHAGDCVARGHDAEDRFEHRDARRTARRTRSTSTRRTCTASRTSGRCGSATSTTTPRSSLSFAANRRPRGTPRRRRRRPRSPRRTQSTQCCG